MKGLIGSIYRRSIVIVAVLLAWTIVPLFIKHMFMPSLIDVLSALVKMLETGEMADHILSSLARAGAGVVISVVLALPLGVLLGWYPKIEAYLNPLFTALRNTSILALLPLFVLFLGVGEISKVAVIVFGCFFPMLLSTIDGVKNVDPVLIQSARSMGISPFGLLSKVVVPAAMGFIISGFRLVCSISLLVLVGAEMLGAKSGLGFLIYRYEQSFQVPKMYAGILVMIVLGILVNWLIGKLERRLTIWQSVTDKETA
ncbi:MAG: ABC transporter permease [Coriobacteriaceae bacterium]|jgi:NitT/TauT family transport system permease protein|nr:ABC transporter permease [Coriobacteriaceae bacterium]